MGKLLKPGRIVIILAGRFAGKKAIILNATESGNKERSFGHCLVAGIQRGPLKVCRGMQGVKMSMNEKQIKKRRTKIDRRSKIKPFLKHINFNHLMPTRYQVGAQEVDIKALLGSYDLTKPEEKTNALKGIKTTLQEKFLAPKPEKGKPNRDLLFLRRKMRF